MSAVENAGELANEQVAVTGDVEIVDYPERDKAGQGGARRGKAMIFGATSAVAMHEASE